MRKIKPWIVLDPLTFTPVVYFVVKDQDGTLIEKIKAGLITSYDTSFTLSKEYTPEELDNIKIEMCNQTLKEKNMSEMTDEEVEYMLTTPWLNRTDNLTPVEFQQLAGIAYN